VYKLVFGPKAFIVISDPVVVRHLLKARSEAPRVPQRPAMLAAGRGCATNDALARRIALPVAARSVSTRVVHIHAFIIVQ
jgi:hypothetical protein